MTLDVFTARVCVILEAPDRSCDLQSKSEQDGLKLLRHLREEGQLRGFGGGRQVC